MADLTFKIVDGPSKFDLMLCVFDHNLDGKIRTSTMVVRDIHDEFVKLDLYISVRSIERTHSNARYWRLEGACYTNPYDPKTHTYTASYDCVQRRGVLTQIVPID